MDKSLLVAVGDDMSSLHGVRFLSSFFSQKENMEVTLCYIAPTSVSKDFQVPAQPLRPQRLDQEITAQYSRTGHESIDAGIDILLSKGFQKAKVTAKYRGKRLGTVKDLVQEGKRGNYDAVLLGRRGYVLFEQALAASVSRQMLDQTVDFPIWICRQPEEGRRHVLLCMDPSEPSMRIADHVGFMLKEEKQHDVKLLCVDDGGQENMNHTLEKGKQLLLVNGVDEERITSQIIKASNVPEAILSEADRNAYAVVAMGRGGAPQKGLFKKWFIGSRSLKVFETISKSVLWLSR